MQNCKKNFQLFYCTKRLKKSLRICVFFLTFLGLYVIMRSLRKSLVIKHLRARACRRLSA